LIALERIDALEILATVFGNVLIPPAVAHEFGVARPWLHVSPPVDRRLVDSLKLLVDDGEAEAIALASERALVIILDDRQARRVAQNIGLRILGTLGCLLKAKAAGVIPAVKPVIAKLEDDGFFLAEELKAEALRLAGE
jgi:predicted nucleic acid-binding protein